MTVRDVELVEMAPPEMPAALYANQVDAYATGEPFGVAENRRFYLAEEDGRLLSSRWYERTIPIRSASTCQSSPRARTSAKAARASAI